MSAALYSLIECRIFELKQIKLFNKEKWSTHYVYVLRSLLNRPTHIVLIWAWCSELGPQYWNSHRSSEGPGAPPSKAVLGERGGLQVV